MATFQEFWSLVLENSFNFGLFFIILFVTYVVARLVRYFLNSHFVKSTKLLKVDPTTFTFFKHASSAFVYLVGLGVAIYSVPTLRTLSVSLFAGAGILAVVVGFASQQALSNIVSGFLISIFKPISVGDKIKIGQGPDVIQGVVEDINLRHTVIRNYENKHVVVPNSVISSEVIENATMLDEKICKHVEFSISYDSDISKAMKIIAQEATKHPLCIDNRSKAELKDGKPQVPVKVIGFGDSSVNLRAWVWAKDFANAFQMHTDLRKSVKERFDKEGIEIPFPYRTIVYKKDLPKNSKK